jgi:phosphoglycerate kinase
MKKMTIEQIQPEGQRVLVRVDFNVPLDDSGNVTDDNRIQAALPTIKKLVQENAKVILMSHLGRPKGKKVDSMSLAPAAARLSDLLGKEVTMAPDCIGSEVEQLIGKMQPGDVTLLENLRFHPEEEANDEEFCKKLASLGDIYVNDAFGTAHRAHASTEGVTRHLKVCAAGYLMEKEIEYLSRTLEAPEKPFVAILGGAKISGKIDVIENLLPKVNSILIGGAMSYTLLKAKGIEVGKSLVEEDRVDMAKEVLDRAKAAGVDFHLPEDHVVAPKCEAGAETRVVDENDIPSDWMGVDIGPKTIDTYKKVISGAKTIVWNGPMGVFEIPEFAKGTFAVAEALADSGGTTIIGGGDSVSAVKKAGVSDKITHISTGGGASLELMEGKELPGLAALSDL